METSLICGQNAPHFLGSFVCNIQGEKAHLFLKDGNLSAKIRKHNGEIIQLSNHQIKGGKKGEMPSEELIDLIKRVTAPLLFVSLKKNDTLCIFLNNFHAVNKFSRPRVLLPPNFYSCVEREGLLTELLLLLQEKQVVILVKDPELPLKRVGKTELATQYFKGYAENYTHTFWIQAISPYHLERGLKKMARTLQISVDQIAEWLRNNKSYLVVFDGIEDVTLIENYLQDVQGHILITSRMEIPSYTCLKVGLLARKEGVSFLLSHIQDSEEDAECVTQTLGDVPSSLYRALEIIKTENLQLSDYITRCQAVLAKNAKEAKGKSNLPARNIDFVGREAGLVALEESFSANKPVVLAANAGLGGVGKTQIALQYAYRTCSNYNLIWWIDSKNMDFSYDGLAKRFQIFLSEEEKKQENALIKKVNRHLEKIPGWLLIFDDAESQENLDGLLPESGGHILITSRNPSWDKSQTEVFGIEVFKREESIDLLLKVTGLFLQENEADQLAEHLQDLPLALAQAAAYIRETGISIQEYIDDFVKMHKALWKREKSTNNYDYTVNITWNISMEKIQAKEKQEGLAPYPIALPLMQICSFFAPSGIPRDTLLLQWIEMGHEKQNIDKGSCLSDLNRTLSLLERYSMVSVTETTISFHTLVQMVTRDQLEEQEKQNALRQILKVFYNLTDMYDPNENPKISSQAELLMHHGETVIENCDKYRFNSKSDDFINLLCIMSLYNLYFGRWSKMKIYAEKRFLAEREMNSSGIRLSSCLTSLGLAYTQLGKFADAQKYLVEPLNSARSLSLQDPSKRNKLHEAKILHNVGQNYMNLGKYRKALKYVTEALELETRLLGIDHSDVAITSSTLGNIFASMGEFDKALTYQMQALEIKKNKRGEEHPEIATISTYIGTSFCALGNYDESLKFLMKALQLRRKFQGVDLSEIAFTLDNIGDVYIALGNYKEALVYQTEALETRKKFEGEEAYVLAFSLNSMGTTLMQLGKHEEALKYLLEALESSKRRLGEVHPSIGMIQNNVSGVFVALGEYDQALKYSTDALNSFRKFHTPTHSNIAMVLSNIGIILANQGQHKEALDYINEALGSYQKCFSEKNTNLAKTLNNLCWIFVSLGKCEEALKYGMEAQIMYKDIFGENHPDRAKSLLNVGNAFIGLGKYNQALDYGKKSLEMHKLFFGKNHPDTALSMNCVGACYFYLSKPKESFEFCSEASDILKVFYGETHPLVLTALINTCSAIRCLGNLELALKYLLGALKHLDDKHVFRCVCQYFIGEILFLQSKTDEALYYFMAALKLRKKLSESASPDLAAILHNISSAYSLLGKVGPYLKYARKALRALEGRFPNNTHPYDAVYRGHLEIARVMVDSKMKELMLQAANFRKQGNFTDSYSSYKEALALHLETNKLKGLSHRLLSLDCAKIKNEKLKCGLSLYDIGVILFELNRNEEALKCYQEALLIFLNTEDNKQFYTDICNRSIGSVLLKLARDEEGLHHYVQGTGIFRICKNFLEGNRQNEKPQKDDNLSIHDLEEAMRGGYLRELFFAHPDGSIGSVRFSEVELVLGKLLLSYGFYYEAECAFRRALEVQSDDDTNDLHSVSILENLASALLEQNKNEEAETIIAMTTSIQIALG